MENNYYSPVQILENNIKAGINKANMGLLKMILLGMFEQRVQTLQLII